MILNNRSLVRFGLYIGVILHLVGSKHVIVKDFARNLVDKRVGDPCTIVSVGDFTVLVSADFPHSDFVRLGVVLDGDLGRHSTHSSDFTPTKTHT